MKDITREQLEAGRPKINVLDGIDFCLDQLFADRTKGVVDLVAGQCSYEELIGILLLAKDKISQQEVEIDDLMKNFDDRY